MIISFCGVFFRPSYCRTNGLSSIGGRSPKDGSESNVAGMSLPTTGRNFTVPFWIRTLLYDSNDGNPSVEGIKTMQNKPVIPENYEDSDA